MNPFISTQTLSLRLLAVWFLLGGNLKRFVWHREGFTSHFPSNLLSQLGFLGLLGFLGFIGFLGFLGFLGLPEQILQPAVGRPVAAVGISRLLRLPPISNSFKSQPPI